MMTPINVRRVSTLTSDDAYTCETSVNADDVYTCETSVNADDAYTCETSVNADALVELLAVW